MVLKRRLNNQATRHGTCYGALKSLTFFEFVLPNYTFCEYFMQFTIFSGSELSSGAQTLDKQG